MRRHFDEDPAIPYGNLTIVEDFLPPPSALIPRKTPTTRVTMEFNSSSIAAFKDFARANKASYQAMIRNLVDLYAQQMVEAAKKTKKAKPSTAH
jgi:hypothetical protein